MKISYIGMKAQEVSIKPGTMKIVMQPDAEVLDEVVVTGMTKVDKRLFTGAADRLTAASVKLDGLPDISRGLEGRSAGVSVQNVSGTFGTAPKIRVRGATSIYGNSKPLWVVDGVIMDDVVEVSADQLSSGDAVTLISSAIAGLNADDIESFQILKDGSATSIYGARAMTDFGPLIANPKSFLLGAAAQFGIFAAYILAIFMGFPDKAAAAISIIGGADGPTSIFLAGKLGQTKYMGPIAVAAYSYMSLCIFLLKPPI